MRFSFGSVIQILFVFASNGVLTLGGNGYTNVAFENIKSDEWYLYECSAVPYQNTALEGVRFCSTQSVECILNI